MLFTSMQAKIMVFEYIACERTMFVEHFSPNFVNNQIFAQRTHFSKNIHIFDIWNIKNSTEFWINKMKQTNKTFWIRYQLIRFCKTSQRGETA